MRSTSLLAAACGLVICGTANAQNVTPAGADTAYDPVGVLVSRLDLEKYKATIKGLAQFGDRRQGT